MKEVRTKCWTEKTAQAEQQGRCDNADKTVRAAQRNKQDGEGSVATQAGWQRQCNETSKMARAA